MEYTIKKLAEMAGVTSRTLRYYDTIDLLKPKRINSSGYRVYGVEEINRLQQILFFREFEIPLEEIKNYLDEPNFNHTLALNLHRRQLLARRDRLDQLLETLDTTMANLRGEITMTDNQKFKGFKQQQLSDNEAKYGQEIREKYGAETVQQANKKFSNLTEEQYDAMQTLADQILTELKDAMQSGDPANEKAQRLARHHKEWLSFTWPTYSKGAHRGLADMYVADERFTKYYDEPAGKGAAQFLRNAIYIFAAE